MTRSLTVPGGAEVRTVAADSVVLGVACLVSFWLTTKQPILRLADTAIGVAVGLAAAWAGLHAIRPLIRPSEPQSPDQP